MIVAPAEAVRNTRSVPADCHNELSGKAGEKSPSQTSHKDVPPGLL
jgi:hypothetical protein